MDAKVPILKEILREVVILMKTSAFALPTRNGHIWEIIDLI